MEKVKFWQKRLNGAKSSILLVAFLTIVNVILIATNADIVFLFSAYVPQVVMDISADIAAEEGINAILYIGIGVSIFMALVYLFLWVGARKKFGFLPAALVFFGIDTVMLLIDIIPYFDMIFIPDIVLHLFIIAELIVGIVAHKKLKKMTSPDGKGMETLTEEQAEKSTYTGAELTDK